MQVRQTQRVVLCLLLDQSWAPTGVGVVPLLLVVVMVVVVVCVNKCVRLCVL